jgi:putative aldouronate transport system permease protein
VSGETTAVGLPELKKQGLIYHIKKEPVLYIMILFPIIHYTIFRYIPIYGITVAFQKFSVAKGYFRSPWVGFKNFAIFFQDPYLFRIVRNTFIINILELVFEFPAPIFLALMLNELKNQTFKRSVQTISYLPHFISTVVLIGILRMYFASDGMVNQLLTLMGLKAQRFLVEPQWFRPLYIGSGIWKNIGWGSILYLAALTGINVELYEASYVDGANRFRRMWHVTLPGIRPTIILLFILRIGRMMNVGFSKVFLLYSPMTYEVADVISTYVYRRGLLEWQISYATAVGLFNSLINCLLLVVANYLAKRFTETSLW